MKIVIRHLLWNKTSASGGVTRRGSTGPARIVYLSKQASPVRATIGFLKGTSAVRIHRELLDHKRMTGLSFWARGYCASTVSSDEGTIRRYIQEQEKPERRQMGFALDEA